jgi:hypothetical protein
MKDTKERKMKKSSSVCGSLNCAFSSSDYIKSNEGRSLWKEAIATYFSRTCLEGLTFWTISATGSFSSRICSMKLTVSFSVKLFRDSNKFPFTEWSRAS